MKNAMGINEFFDVVLQAPPSNPRWSWGGIDEANRRVFLRVWKHHFDPQVHSIKVQFPDAGKSKAAFNERNRHIGLVAEGFQLFGVLCILAEKTGRNDAKIDSFDTENLLKLGKLRTEADGQVFVTVEGQLALSEIVSEPCLVKDLNQIVQSKDLDITTRTALIEARLGQGLFRRKLMGRYKNACAVTGCSVTEVLRASHIKPWARSENHERLDPHNGLLLSANLDALFDRGLISFTGDGDMCRSPRLNLKELKRLGSVGSLLTPPSKAQQKFLAFHRKLYSFD